jgi:PleD family two-component response regulator
MIAAIISKDDTLRARLKAASEGAAAVEAVQPSLERSPLSNRALRILIAEDSEDSFFLFQAYLKDQPHIVSRAVNGAEAVDLATAETFNIVFMDIRMPVMDGYEATRRIRDWERSSRKARLRVVPGTC